MSYMGAYPGVGACPGHYDNINLLHYEGGSIVIPTTEVDFLSLPRISKLHIDNVYTATYRILGIFED